MLAVGADWLNGNVGTAYNWSASVDDSAIVLKFQLEDPVPFTELDSQPLDGVGYHAMSAVRPSLAYLCVISLTDDC